MTVTVTVTLTLPLTLTLTLTLTGRTLHEPQPDDGRRVVRHELPGHALGGLVPRLLPLPSARGIAGRTGPRLAGRGREPPERAALAAAITMVDRAAAALVSSLAASHAASHVARRREKAAGGRAHADAEPARGIAVACCSRHGPLV